MATLLGQCPKCGGNMYWEGDGLKCLQCGHGPLNKTQKHAYFLVNRDRILADIEKLGFGPTLRKWHLRSSNIHSLRHSASFLGLTGEPAPVPAPSRNGLPHLPEFSNDWSPEVQIKWLEIWAERR